MTDPTAHIDNVWSRANRTTVKAEMENRSSNPWCTTCKEQRRLLAMPGYSWGWEAKHEEHCPQHEDHQPTVQVHLVDLASDMLREHVEISWGLTDDPGGSR